MISTVEGGAFISLSELQSLDLGRNRLSKFNSDVFQGIENLEKLDLSENFISDFPTVALKSFASLKNLNLSSNMISVIKFCIPKKEIISLCIIIEINTIKTQIVYILKTKYFV